MARATMLKECVGSVATPCTGDQGPAKGSKICDCSANHKSFKKDTLKIINCVCRIESGENELLDAMCLQGACGDAVDELAQRFEKLYQQKPLSIKRVFAKSMSMLSEIEYELSAPGTSFIELLQERVKIVQCVGGVVLYFHYETMLRPQIQIIAKLMKALTSGGHALLESPTGTGKTAAVVAGVTSWLKYYSSKSESTNAGNGCRPRIQVFYLTRTHSQIKQVLGEFRRCCFRLDVACLGSRWVACPMAPLGGDLRGIDEFCQAARAATELRESPREAGKRSRRRGASSGCHFYKGLESKSFAAQIHFKCRTVASRIGDPERKARVLRLHGPSDGIWDIEELVSICLATDKADNCVNRSAPNEAKGPKNAEKRQRAIDEYLENREAQVGCPYYVAKSLSALANVVICPYSYAIDLPLAATDSPIVESALSAPKSEFQRELLERSLSALPARAIGAGAKLPLENSVIIIDEAHNIEAFSRERGSFEISQAQLKSLRTWVRGMFRDHVKHVQGRSVLRAVEAVQDHVAHLHEFIAKFSACLAARASAFPGSSSFSWDRYDCAEDRLGGTAQFMSEFGLTLFESFLSLASLYYVTSFSVLADVYNFASPLRELLSNFLCTLTLVCRHHRHYTVYLEWAAGNCTLKFWLQHAGAVFDVLARCAKSLVLVSGTLAPLDSTSAALGGPFMQRLGNCTLEAQHVISRDQFAVYTLSTIPEAGKSTGKLPEAGKSIKLECVHKNLQKDEFLISLGTAIANIASLLPGNILIFFPNRALVHRCMELWKKTGNGKNSIGEQLARAKKEFFVEPKSGTEFHKIAAHMRAAESFTLLATFRGHASEGLNLSVQSLVLIGLPFANRGDPCVDAALRFSAACAAESPGTAGDWYLTDTFRAVNQSIGRCIRKRSDRGIVLLLDSRHALYQRNLSTWLRPHLTHVSSLDQLMSLLRASDAGAGLGRAGGRGEGG